MQATKWNKFLKELDKLFFFWIVGIIFFFFFRLCFILIFREELGGEVGMADYVNTFFMGFRFDCTIMGYFLLIPLLSLFIFAWFDKFRIIKTIRVLFQTLFLILSVVICVITLNYYYEYREQFNNFIFLGLDDDQSAIWNTIIEYYNPILNLSVVIGFIVIGLLIFHFFEKRDLIYKSLLRIKPLWMKSIFIFLLLFLFVCGLRGSFTKVPAMRKWAAVTKDPFLNKTIINPYRSLKYAYQDFKNLNFNAENPFTDEELYLVFQQDSVRHVIEKTAKGTQIEKPKQVFLVIMESYDSWPLMEKYVPFGFSEKLSRIAANGSHFTHFLPSYNATAYAYNTIVTGIPYCGVNMSYIGSLNDPYVTSIFNQFKKLGYKTNFFYGGFLSWQNIGNFTYYQGCDHIYSGIDMGGKSDSGDWGVEDEKLFDLVLEKINEDEYTLNVILTSSYHAPYAIDVEKKGFPYKSPEDFPEEVKQYYKGGMSMKEMGHLWYGDYEIGRFVERAVEKYENGLYCFTGDHYGRRFLNSTPTLYEKSSVPFIVYGKDVPVGKMDSPGDHADIIPTLIELIAPEEFVYYSFGSSLYEKDKTYGIAFEKVIDRDSLFYFPKDRPMIKQSLTTEELKEGSYNKYLEDYKRRMMLAWHYIMRGEDLRSKSNRQTKK